MGIIKSLFGKSNMLDFIYSKPIVSDKNIINEVFKLLDDIKYLEESDYFIISKNGYVVASEDDYKADGTMSEYVENPKVLKKDISYLGMSYIWSLNSHCLRKKTGALIIKDNMIISDGYNGTPYGFDNVCEENGVTKENVLHAEVNALAKIAKSTNSSNNAVMYCTLSPCMNCARLIYQAGIKKLVFSSIYRDVSGIKFLIEAGVLIKYINKKTVDKSIIDGFNL